jgi:phosphoribosylformylglycinamidine synthase I
MTIGVLVFPGSNCDHDAYHAIKHVLGVETRFIFHKETDLTDIDAIIVPGGFSYGDYLRSGAIAKFSPVMQSVGEFASRGGLVIGICNGFQILLESGLLPGAMLHNEQLRFTCKQIYLRTESRNTPFTSEIPDSKILKVPIAHGEGNYYADHNTLNRLIANDQIIFRYTDQHGIESPDFNPNGALLNIAGICNESRNVLGMMPHPERAMESILGSTDGKYIFESMMKHLVPA